MDASNPTKHIEKVSNKSEQSEGNHPVTSLDSTEGEDMFLLKATMDYEKEAEASNLKKNTLKFSNKNDQSGEINLDTSLDSTDGEEFLLKAAKDWENKILVSLNRRDGIDEVPRRKTLDWGVGGTLWTKEDIIKETIWQNMSYIRLQNVKSQR